MRERAEVDRRQVVDTPVFSFEPSVGGGRELALGEAVHAVVLDDVDHRHVAPDQVHELAEADRGGVAVAGDADAEQLRLASIAPVATAGMRPWTALKPCEALRK